PYGVPILVGGATARAALERGYILTLVDNVRVKGRVEPVEVHALLGGPDHPVAPERLTAAEAVARVARARAQGGKAALAAALEEAQRLVDTEFAPALAMHKGAAEVTRKAETSSSK
ncbi:hypothetical protein AB9K41_27150, partial [Cribrihabitans sp. XS_ASV171]